jgi:RNA polymerase sigma factor (sigma-70 family)
VSGFRGGTVNPVVRILDHLEAAQGDRTDGQLLDLFVRLRDQDAFAAVVKRHGPMVLGVCQRVLRNSADADDAFQAAFLVLARRAASLGSPDQLAPWLYGVAFNTARKLRRTIARRAVREGPLEPGCEPQGGSTQERDELLAVLDQELTLLPERYRRVLVLCDLEGLTRREAAQVLVCPEGTVAGRLARARDLLAARLSTRGVLATAGMLALVLAERAAVALPPTAVLNVVRAVSVDGLSRAVTRGLVSPRVAATTEGVLRSMFATRLRTAAAAILCCGLLLAGALGVWPGVLAQPPSTDPLRIEGNPRPVKAPEKALADAAGEPRVLTVFPLKKLEPEATAKVIADAYKGKGVTVTALKTDRALMLYASEKHTQEIVALLRKLGESAPKKATVLHLPKAVDPTIAAKSIQRSITEPRSADIVVVPVPEENALLVYASDEDTKEILRLLRPTVGGEPVLRAIQLKKLNAEDVAPELRELLTPEGRLVPLATQNQIIVQDHPEGLKRIEQRVRELEERVPDRRPDPSAPAPPKKFAVRFKNTKWDDLLTWYAEASGLTLITTVKPTGNFTFEPPAGAQFTLPEITDVINEALTPQKLILIRRHMTFFIHPADERIGPDCVPRIELGNLPTRGRTELVEVRIPLRRLDAAEIKDDLAKMLTRFGAIEFARGRELIIRDTGGNIDRIAQTIDALDKADRTTAKPAPEPKKYQIKFERAAWKDVFAWYAQESGLERVGTALPGGTFTLVPPYTRPEPSDPLKTEPVEKPVPRQSLTLDEITDRINEALLGQKWLLVPRPREKTFLVVPADENVDPKLFRAVSRADLATEGKFTLVEVTIDFTRPGAPELIAVLRTKLSPFGRLVPVSGGTTITVRDIAGHLRDLVPPRPVPPPTKITDPPGRGR